MFNKRGKGLGFRASTGLGLRIQSSFSASGILRMILQTRDPAMWRPPKGMGHYEPSSTALNRLLVSATASQQLVLCSCRSEPNCAKAATCSKQQFRCPETTECYETSNLRHPRFSDGWQILAVLVDAKSRHVKNSKQETSPLRPIR